MPANSPRELVAALAAAIDAGDLEAALALWEPQARIIATDGSSVAGHEAIAAVLRAMIESGTRFAAEVHGVHLAGDLALVTGNLKLTADDGNSHVSPSVVVHRRAADGFWRIALDAPWGLPA